MHGQLQETVDKCMKNPHAYVTALHGTAQKISKTLIKDHFGSPLLKAGTIKNIEPEVFAQIWDFR